MAGRVKRQATARGKTGATRKPPVVTSKPVRPRPDKPTIKGWPKSTGKQKE